MRVPGETEQAGARTLEETLHAFEEVIAARVVWHPDGEPSLSLLVAHDTDVDRLEPLVLEQMRRLTGHAIPDVGITLTRLGSAAYETPPMSTPDPLVDEPRVRPDRARIPHLSSGRPTLESVLGVTRGTSFTAEVTLRMDDGDVGAGRASSLAGSTAMDRAIAEATLHATSTVDRSLASAYVEGVREVAIGRELAILVLVSILDDDSTLGGVAIIRGAARMEAIARACLDAVNRRIG